MGLSRAGFYVMGVDNRPQPHYCGDEFFQADAMTFPLDGYDFIWASPPCQAFTALRTMPNAKQHADLLTPTRERLKAIGIPYVIENVPGAPLNRGATMLCGTMFGLGTKCGRFELRRHRYFESSHALGLTQECRHNLPAIGVYGSDGRGRVNRRALTITGHAGSYSNRDKSYSWTVDSAREALGIDWMGGNELTQAIPPAYSQWVGERMMPAVTRKEVYT
jgi:DNA (cytosine-5)-methyltransferase 1